MACRQFSDEKTVDEFVASPRRNRVTLNHVHHCPQCQFLVRDRRLQRLQRLRRYCYDSNAEEGAHITGAVLQSFAQDRLNDAEMMQVMDHLRRCASCVGALQVLHSGMN